MASKRRVRARACGNKKRFSTRAEAANTAWHVDKRFPRPGFHLEAYRCPFCRGWHFGSKGGASGNLPTSK